jgi:hypothetical protein
LIEICSHFSTIDLQQNIEDLVTIDQHESNEDYSKQSDVSSDVKETQLVTDQERMLEELQQNVEKEEMDLLQREKVLEEEKEKQAREEKERIEKERAEREEKERR